MKIDSAQVANYISEIAAEEIVPRFGRLRAEEVIDKGGGDPVTAADLESEKRLTKCLSDLLPGSRVVGEEAVHADPNVIDSLSNEGQIWIIDPLDGTNNFSKGSEIFAVMVALLSDGKTIAAWIYSPISDIMTIAEAGGGSWQNGSRLQTSLTVNAAAEMNVSVHTGYVPEPPKSSMEVAAKAFKSNRPLYCAGQVYVDVATGFFDGAFYWRVKPWDHAPGSLIVIEAGGAVRYIDDGKPYTAIDQGRHGLIASANDEVWEVIHNRLVRRKNK